MFHIVDVAKERCRPLGDLPADIVLLARPAMMERLDRTLHTLICRAETQSIQRALAVLRILAAARAGLGLSEGSMHAGLTRPTTHRILGVLVAEGTTKSVALNSKRIFPFSRAPGGGSDQMDNLLKDHS